MKTMQNKTRIILKKGKRAIKNEGAVFVLGEFLEKLSL